MNSGLMIQSLVSLIKMEFLHTNSKNKKIKQFLNLFPRTSARNYRSSLMSRNSNIANGWQCKLQKMKNDLLNIDNPFY